MKLDHPLNECQTGTCGMAQTKSGMKRMSWMIGALMGKVPRTIEEEDIYSVHYTW